MDAASPLRPSHRPDPAAAGLYPRPVHTGVVLVSLLALIWFAGTSAIIAERSLAYRILVTALDFIPWLVLLGAAAAAGWRYAPRRLRPHHLLAMLSLAAGLVIARVLFLAVLVDFLGLDLAPWKLLIFFPWHVMFVSSAIAAGAAARMILLERAQVAALAELERDLARARLQRLREMLDPGLLLRALASIEREVHARPAVADTLIVQLGHLLRLQLHRARRDLVTLAEEIEYARAALLIADVLDGTERVLRFEGSADLWDVLVPRGSITGLLGQPKEGAPPGGGERAVRAGEREGCLCLTIHGGVPAAAGGRAAVEVVERTLREQYGEEFELASEDGPAGRSWTLVTPLRVAAEREPARTAAAGDENPKPPLASRPADAASPGRVPDVPTDLLAWLLGYWGLIFLLALLRDVVVVGIGLSGSYTRGAATAAVWLGTCLLALAVVRGRPIAGYRHVLAFVLAGAVLTAATLLVQHAFSCYPRLHDTCAVETRLALATLVFPLTFATVLSFLSLGLAVGHARAFRAGEIRAARDAAEISRAQASSLAGQLRPHFLFNCLQSIATLLHHDGNAAGRMLSGLRLLLENALRLTDEPAVPLRQELFLLELYLAIERTRFEDRLQVECRVASGVRDALVPPFLLQPVLENAIEHATATAGEGWIAVDIEPVDGMRRLRLCVRNSAPCAARLGRSRHGVGLTNTRARLENLFADDFAFALDVEDDGACAVTIVLPLLRQPLTPEAV
jgi:hypothetical protein